MRFTGLDISFGFDWIAFVVTALVAALVGAFLPHPKC